MELFDVYNQWSIEPVKGEGVKVWDSNGVEYLDLYGGHAVISIGHRHPHFTAALKEQIDLLSFYSNATVSSLQSELAKKLGQVSLYPHFSLFLSNSGAEANENAFKVASFNTGRGKVLSFKGAFHGRSSGAVAATDIPSIVSPFNSHHKITFLEVEDLEGAERELSSGEYAAVIIEGIQGVGGVIEPSSSFFKGLRELTNRWGTLLILDEVQSGYGRTGKFFAHQHAAIEPDIITVAKGMGNGFPIGGTLISPKIEAKKGMLGSTFGGNHLACRAALAVLEVIEQEQLIENAARKGEYLISKLRALQEGVGEGIILEVRGRGLMVGIEFEERFVKRIKESLLFENKIFTGSSKTNIIRILP
ncbi:MAG: aspartate aminotransferase family protein, partial [Bacteroidales bacterium]